MKLRTVDAAYKEILEEDPNTAITKNFIRTGVITGRIPCVRAGKKYLFRVEDLYQYIESEIARAADEYQKMVEENRK